MFPTIRLKGTCGTCRFWKRAELAAYKELPNHRVCEKFPPVIEDRRPFAPEAPLLDRSTRSIELSKRLASCRPALAIVTETGLVSQQNFSCACWE